MKNRNISILLVLILFMFTIGCTKEEPEELIYADKIYDMKSEYIGDNASVINLIEVMGFNAWGEYTLELFTEKEPFGLEINYSNMERSKIDESDLELYSNLLLGLIKNLDYVNTVDNDDIIFEQSLESLNDSLDFDIKEIGENKAELEKYLMNYK